MRLTEEQQRSIHEVVHPIAGERTKIVLFGSRSDAARRGGNIDLLIETDRKLGMLDKARIKMQIEARLGLPVDVIVHTRGTPMTAFQRIASETGIVLERKEGEDL